MKKIFLLTLLASIFSTSISIAMENVPKNSISAQALGIIYGTTSIEYERAFDNSAIAIRGKYFNMTSDSWSYTSTGVGASYRFFPGAGATAPKGFYLGPSIDFNSYEAKYSLYTISAKGTSLLTTIGAEIGYKFIFGDKIGFVVSPHLIGNYTLGELKVEGDVINATPQDFSGVGFGLGCSVGFAF